MSFFFYLPQSEQVNPAQTRMIKQLSHSRPLLSCKFDPSGRFAFAGAQDNAVHRWDLSNDRKVSFENGHDSWIRGMDFVPEQNKLITGGYDGNLVWWQLDAAAPAPLRTVEAHDGWVRAVAVSPNGEIVASCGNDHLVKLWNASDGALVRELRGHDCHVYNLAFHPNGQFLVSADHRGQVKQWNLSQGRVMRTFDASVLHRYDNTFRAIIGGIRGMAFNPEGTLLACTGIVNVSNAFAGVGNPGVVLFDFETGQRRHLLRTRQSFRGTAWGVIFHPSGFLAATGGGRGGKLWFWRPDNDRDFAVVNLPNNARDLDLHPDGRRLAIPFYDSKLRIYDMVPAS